MPRAKEEAASEGNVPLSRGVAAENVNSMVEVFDMFAQFLQQSKVMNDCYQVIEQQQPRTAGTVSASEEVTGWKRHGPSNYGVA